MKIAILAMPQVEHPDELLSWLKGYLEAIGLTDITVEQNFSIERLEDVFQQVDAIILAGVAGNPQLVSKVAKVLGLGTEVNADALELVKSFYMDKAELPKNLEDLAVMPEFSYVIPNERGPVPSFVAFSLESEKFVAATPPSFEETIEAFEKGIQDFFRQSTGKKFSVTFSLDLECQITEANEVINAVRREVRNVFPRLDGRFYTGKGFPLTFTVYSSTPEELSETMEKIQNIVLQVSREKGIKIIEKQMQETEENL
uniref:MoaB/Mog domain-containing protein n=1 Tax=Thermofilum adornatum TaxID=1365176 RepID=A0A7C1CEI7_9CREN